MNIPELMVIRIAFNNFKNLGATELQLQNREFTYKMGKLKIHSKIKLKLIKN